MASSMAAAASGCSSRLSASEPISMKREKQFVFLLLALAGLFGLYVRLGAPMQADFPVLDGGLFYTMAADLAQNGFRLPLTTSYNNLSIPFAYPPLGIMLIAELQRMTGWNLLEIVQWLPVFFSLLTLPMFYLLAREMLDSPAQAALATLFFALLPRAYEWLIMGGGISRAPGALFHLAFAWAAYRAFARREWRMSLWAALFGGLTLLTHPERVLVGGRPLPLRGRDAVPGRAGWRSARPVLGAAAATEFHRRGCSFCGVAGCPRRVCLLESAQRIAGSLVRIDLFHRPAQRAACDRYSGLAAGGYWADRCVLPGVGAFFRRLAGSAGKNVRASGAGIRAGGDAFQCPVESAPDWKICPARRGPAGNGLAVSAETPPDSRFLVLDWQEIPMLSPLLEWFPALSGRTNVTTIQGREWLPGAAHFTARVESYPDLYACLDQDAACLDDWAGQNEETFDYVYLSLNTPGGETRLSRLSDSLRASPQYRLVYQTPDVLIFERMP